MKKRWIALILAALLLVAVGCGGAAQSSESQMANVYDDRAGGGMAAAPMAPMASSAPAPAAAPAPAPDMVYEDMTMAEAESGWDSGQSRAINTGEGGFGGHKIIRNAYLALETRDFDANIAHIRQKTDELGGYIGSSNASGRKPEKHGDSGRYASLTIRIPQEQMEAFLQDTRGLATVTSENSSSEDITSSYFDTESRVEIYETQRERILELLAKAETMESIIALETELSRLTYEIESLTTQLNRWDDLVSYASVHVDIYEIPPAMPTITNDDSISTRISEGFQGTLGGVAVFFEDLFVFLISASPVLVILALIVVAVLLIIRRASRKRKERREKEGKNVKPQKAPSHQIPYGKGHGVPATESRETVKKDDAQAPDEKTES